MGVKKVLIVGAGTMGHGIAQTFAVGGFKVSLVDISQKVLDKAAILIKSSLQTMADEEVVTKNRIPDILGLITFSTNLAEQAKDADIVIEAVVEDKEVKKTVFTELDKCCSPETLLTSNTTQLNIFDFVEVSHPDRLLICHWYVPPEIIPLVDVVKGPDTSEKSVNLMVEILKKIGKQPLIMQKFVAGYVIPRLQGALQPEIQFLLDSGAVTPEEMDNAVKAGLAFRMMVVGVVQRIDFGGLDLTARLLKNPYVRSHQTPADYMPKKIFELVEQGNLGVKTGKGFYDYGGRSEEEVCRERDIKLIRLLKALQDLEIIQ